MCIRDSLVSWFYIRTRFHLTLSVLQQIEFFSIIQTDMWCVCGRADSTDAYVQLFGPRQAEAIVLPPCENYMNVEVQRTVASKMLTRGLQRGLVIHSANNNIYVYRLCQ